MNAGYAGPGSDLQPNEATIHGFVAWWFQPCRQGRIEVGWTDAAGRGLVHHRFALNEAIELATLAASVNLVPGQNIYLRPATVTTPPGELTADTHFCQAPGPWNDIDTPEQATRARGVQTFLRPNGVIRTGTVPHERFQQLFRCSEPIVDADTLRRFNRGLHAVYGGDRAVTNPTSYMRLPGTIAWPLKAGRIPELTAFIQPESVSGAYPLGTLASQLPQDEGRTAQRGGSADIGWGDGATDPYGHAGLEAECARIREAKPGAQRNTLFAAAASIGELIAGGHIEPAEGRQALIEAGLGMVNDPHSHKGAWTRKQVERVVADGIGKGMRKPRGPGPAPQVVEMSEFLSRVGADASGEPEAGPVAEPYDPLAERALPAGVMDVDGLLRRFVDWNVASAVSPQPFLSLGAAMCVVGTLAGRRYCGPTGLRSNIYVVGIADSGGGKEQPRQGIKRAFAAANMLQCLGGNLASGPAIATSLAASPSRLYLMDEFGKELAKWTAERAPAYLADIWTKLTSLYTEDLFLGPEYTDQAARPRVTVPYPALCLYGSTVPEPFWKALRHGSLRDGSVARLLVFLAAEDYPERNRCLASDKVPDELIAHMHAIDAGAEGHDYGGNLALQPAATPTLYRVRANATANELLDTLQEDQMADLRANDESSPARAVISRRLAAIHKVALIRAISRTPASPTITVNDVDWAVALVKHSQATLLREAERHIADGRIEERKKMLLEIIRRSPGISKSELTTASQNMLARERNELLEDLVTGGEIYAREQPSTGGRKPTCFFANPERRKKFRTS